jgi:TPR repeat protein
MSTLPALWLAAMVLGMVPTADCAGQPPAPEGPVATQGSFTGFAYATTPFSEAFARLLNAARNGDRAATDSLLGHWRGIGYVPPDQEAAFYLWLAGSAESTGSAAGERREAAFRAGTLYHDGRGVGRDLAEAARWWQRAAEAGHREAQYQLGRLLGEGADFAGKDREARRWLTAAARQGHAGAQYRLGMLYQYGGAGVVPDDVEAYRWYSLAARQGHALADDYRRMLYDDLSSDELAEVQRRLDAASAR